MRRPLQTTVLSAALGILLAGLALRGQTVVSPYRALHPIMKDPNQPNAPSSVNPSDVGASTSAITPGQSQPAQPGAFAARVDRCLAASKLMVLGTIEGIKGTLYVTNVGAVLVTPRAQFLVCDTRGAKVGTASKTGAALAEMNACALPILCGGTGMYFSALINGIAEVPDPGVEARTEARRLLAEIGAPGAHALLDMETAAKLKPGDSQRVARAYEVLIGTGKGLAAWQRQTTHRLEGWRVRMILLDPPREVLREAIAARFEQMLAAGAVEEVRDFLALGLDASLPLMRAHGVPELGTYLRGEITLAEATARAVLATHQYTKRQMTWFRHQKLVDSPDMQIIQSRIVGFAQLLESFIGSLVNFINTPG